MVPRTVAAVSTPLVARTLTTGEGLGGALDGPVGTGVSEGGIADGGTESIGAGPEQAASRAATESSAAALTSLVCPPSRRAQVPALIITCLTNV